MLFAEHLKTLAEISHHPSNMQRRSGALLDYLRWNFGHRIMGAEYVLPLVGDARLILSNRQNFATLVYTCGLWDFAEQAFLLHLLGLATPSSTSVRTLAATPYWRAP